VPGPSDPYAEAANLEGVPSSFAATRDGIDTLLRDRGLRRTGPDVTAESLLQGAAASAALEGWSYDLAALRAGAAEVTALSAARMSTELLGLVPVWQQAPLQAVARLHALAAAGAASPGELGRPVNPAGARRLAALAASLRRPTEAPGMVVAALVHAEIVAAGAFVSHNAVVARAAERIEFVAAGVDPASVTVPEAGHLALEADYRQSLQAYVDGGPAGPHQWLLYAAQAYAAGAELCPLVRQNPPG